MIERRLENTIREALARFPVVGLVGARQVGKTTLARMLFEQIPGKAVYLDLERPSDLAKLREPELYLQQHTDKLIILDEIQRKPDLFPILRVLVDDNRRNGRFLILGSASPDLIRTSSESLAGRIIYYELPPLILGEVSASLENIRLLWCRGGFPRSFLAPSDGESREWREAFIGTYLERDLPMLGSRISSSMLRRFWHMLAHSHSQLWNASPIAAGLGVSAPTVRHYLDILKDTYMVRQLQPFSPNLKKRLVKSPKIYLRDSGLLHALLGIETMDELMGHPVLGASWEGWVVEQILSLAPRTWKPYFYRTGAGAEIDLVLERPGTRPLLALEIKFSADPAPSRGFWSALSDLKGAQGHVVCPAEERYPLGKNLSTLPVLHLEQFLRENSGE